MDKLVHAVSADRLSTIRGGPDMFSGIRCYNFNTGSTAKKMVLMGSLYIWEVR
jgi:hypothetical protein